MEPNEEETSKTSVNVGEYEDELESVETSNVVPKLEPEDVSTYEVTLDSDVTHVNLMDIFKVEREGVEMTPGTQQLKEEKNDFKSEDAEKSKTTYSTENNDNNVNDTYLKIFKKRDSSTKLIRTHSSDKPYSCRLCEKSFTKHCNLMRHIRKHTGERPYSCSQCSKSFSQQFNLIRHLRIHRGEKPYSCIHCEKSFSQNNLIRHMRTHTGVKFYICDHCEKIFKRKHNLMKHMRLHEVVLMQPL